MIQLGKQYGKPVKKSFGAIIFRQFRLFKVFWDRSFGHFSFVTGQFYRFLPQRSSGVFNLDSI